jgi:hypothetical protein
MKEWIKWFVTKIEDIPCSAFTRVITANTGKWGGAILIELYTKKRKYWYFELIHEDKVIEKATKWDSPIRNVAEQYNKSIRDLLLKENPLPTDYDLQYRPTEWNEADTKKHNGIKDACTFVNNLLWQNTEE